jgi:ParB-like nuclease domain
MMRKPDHEFLDDGAGALTEQLRVKSRRRRKGLVQLSSPDFPRNDLLPPLALIYLPLSELPPATRKVRKIDPAHVRDVAASIRAFGFCAPILIGRDNVRLDGEIRVEAARLLGLDCLPCLRIDHLSEKEQRVLRLAANRLGEKGEWDLGQLRIEFEELSLEQAPIEVSGFTLNEIDQIIIGDEAGVVEAGPLEPEAGAVAIARVGDVFELGPHRLVCGDAADPQVLKRLMDGDPAARLVLTDEPYNVSIAGHVTGGAHREFVMGSGEMTDAEFLTFNEAWIAAVRPFLCDGGVFGTFIDWRGQPTVHSAATNLGLKPLNLSSGRRPTPAWGASTARNTNSCRCSRRD